MTTMLADIDEGLASLQDALRRAWRKEAPFRHWLLDDTLPASLCGALRALPVEAPEIGETEGKRATHNGSRLFLSAAAQARFPACRAVAAIYQHPKTIAAIRALCGVDLAGSHLRVELCLDTREFWLEPHTDIGAKLFTHLVYLSTGPGSEAWGTDLLAPDGNLVARPAAYPNSGLIFVPASDTWHGFEKRRIMGVRRTLIVNYVRPEWRSRHELAFPSEPVA